MAEAQADDWEDVPAPAQAPSAKASPVQDDWEDVPQAASTSGPLTGAKEFGQSLLKVPGEVLEAAPVMTKIPRTAGEMAIQGLSAPFDPGAIARIGTGIAKNIYGAAEEPPASASPVYKAGEALAKGAEEAVPVTPQERAEHPIWSGVGRGMGAMVPAMIAGRVDPALGIAIAATQFGLTGASDTYKAAKEHGADEHTATQAAEYSAGINAAMGMIPVGVVFKPLEQFVPQAAPLVAKILYEAGRDGVTFTGLNELGEYVGQKLASMYDPKAHYEFDWNRLAASFLTGGIFGAGHAVLGGHGEAAAEQPATAPAATAAAAAAPPARPRGTGAEAIAGLLGPEPESKSILPEAAPEWAAKLDTTPGVKAYGQDQADALKRVWSDTSPIKSIDGLFENAKENQGDLVKVGKSIAEDIGQGVEFKDPGVKGRGRTQEKIDEGKSPGRINDVVRGGFEIQRPQQAEAVVARLAARYPIIDEGWGVTAAGYFDRKVLVRFPDGQAGEIQLWHPDILRTKEDKGSKLYEEARTLPSSDPRKAELEAEMERIYSQALENADPDWKAVVGSAGRLGNLAAKSAFESTRPSIPTTEEFAGRQSPAANVQASPGVQTKGSPSQVPNLNFRSAINRNIGPDGTINKAVPGIPPHRVTAADGTAVDVAPVVVEASDLRTSQDPGYDASLQPRQRERAASQAQVRDIASNLDPERLGYSAEADRGAPIVGPDGMVESGNGRILALRSVYERGGKAAEAYRDWLTKQGVDVSAFRNPVLVRQRATPFTPEQRRSFTVAANQAATLAMSAPERAMADAARIPPAMLSVIHNPDDLGAVVNRPFFRRFVAYLPQAEQGTMVDASGALSAEGLTRVRNAILAKAYGDPATLTRIAESTNDEIKSISNAMVAAAPQWARMRADVEDGRVRRDADMTPQLLEAVSRTADLRSKGIKIDDYLAQLDAFERPAPAIEDFMRAFYHPETRRAASAKQIVDALRFYAQEASKLSTDKSLGLDMAPVDPAQITRLMRKKGEEDAGRRQELSDRRRPDNGPDNEAAGREVRGFELGAAGEGVGPAGEGGAEETTVRAQRLTPEERRNFVDPYKARDAAEDALRKAGALPVETVPLAGGKKGEQYVIPGAEKITDAELARVRAASPLRAQVPQEVPGGLFGDLLGQEELFARAPEDLTPRETVPISDKNLFGEAPSARGSRPVGTALRGRAPQVAGKQQPRVPTPAKRPNRLSLFEGGGGRGELGTPNVPIQPQPRTPEVAGTGPSESVTKPPAVGGRTDTRRTDNGTPAPRAGIREAEQKIAERSRSNYRITPEDQIGVGGPKQKVGQNIEAIRLLKQLEDEGREATPAEKAVLVKYTGWGAFAQQMFDEFKRRPEWDSERGALRALLTDEEWNAAKHSVTNAYFTSPEVISGMWDALSHLGYEGGSAIEPAAGIGHFIGLVPDAVAHRTAWTAVELDSVSARLTKALYGGTEVNETGFEKLKRPSNYYDLAISNVPFSEVKISEKPYGSFPLHDFFFVKSLDKVRPGGVVAFITSRYTMDRADTATRRLLAKSSDLVGAIRLPGGNKGAFAQNAGTAVTTDILFLRKKTPGEKPFEGGKWADTKVVQTPEGPIKINEYFADNPKMMLGEMRLTGTQYRADEPVLIGDTEGLQQKIADAARTMQAGAMAPRIEKPTLENLPAIDTGGVKDGGFFLKDGKMYRRVAGEGVPHEMSPDNHDRVTRLMGMRDLYDKILDAQLNGTDAGPDREKLRAAYKAFVDKYGPINKETQTVTSRLNSKGEPVVITRQPNFRAFREDPDAWKVASIEDYDAEKGTARAADIQNKDVLRPPVTREINGPSDALAAALNDTGRVDLDHVAGSLGLDSIDEAAGSLGNLIFHDPNGRQWKTADEYLSGNVVQKLEEARAIAQNEPLYLRNVAALEKVQPQPIPPGADITTQFGAPWVPADVYSDFIKEVLGAGKVQIGMVPTTGQWKIEADRFANDARTKFGTNHRGAGLGDVLEAALNNRKLTVRGEKDAEGNRPILPQATEDANNKVALLREAFSGDPEFGIDGWVWQDPERSDRLAGIFNRTYNNLAPLNVDGSHLTLPGLNPKFSDRQHRKDAVWRIIQHGNTLLAHEVGSGKTVTMIAAGMEQKRLGLIQKPAYVVPNHMLEQFSREFIEAYPDARILVASKDEMSADQRKAFIAKTAANDWDGIVITHDAFGRINVNDKFRRAHVQEQIDQYENMIAEEAENAGAKAPTVKALEKAKDKLVEKLNKLMAAESKDEGLNFEHTGIDQLFVDEAHLFKNLSFPTRMAQVKGLGQGDAQRAEDLFLKIRYLEQSKPGRSAIFATGTPVSNTMAEMWTMQRYLQLDKLRERGLENFDKWANTFGKTVTRRELGADGRTLEDVTSFSEFVNIPELVALYAEVADTKTAEMLKLPRPDVKTRSGAPGIEVVQAEPSDAEEKAIRKLVAEAQEMKAHPKRPEKGDRIMLNVVTDGRKVATDGRLLDKEADFNPRGKVALAVDNISRIYQEGNKDPDAPNKVQMVFLDMGVPGSEKGFNLYADIKKRLVDKGIPAKEIASIHDADNDVKKARLFNDTRAGKVRVIMGSTGKMGMGTNVQKRLIAMHHIDAPWKPAEVTQRDGRIVRQGNMNDAVQIYRYVTKHSFDAFMWQKLERKARFLTQILSGTKGSRTAEDVDSPLPEASEMKAAASGDPRIIEHAELDRTVRALSSQRRTFESTQARANQEIGSGKSRIEQYEKALPNARDDAAMVKETAGDKFSVDLGDKGVLTDRKEAGKAILDGLMKLDPRGFYRPAVVHMGKLSGFDMNMEVRSGWDGMVTSLKATPLLKGKSGYGATNDIVVNEHTDPVGLMMRYEKVLRSIKDNPERLDGLLKAERTNVDRLEKTLGEKWPKEKEYKAAIAKLSELGDALKAPKSPDVVEEEAKARRAEGEEAATGPRPGEHKIELSPKVTAYVSDKYTAAEQKIADAVQAIGKRMAPQIEVLPTKALRIEGERVWGAFVKSGKFPGLIAWSLEKGTAGAAARTVRHEILHHLKSAGLIRPDEWKALEKGAKDGDWVKKYEIDDIYPDLSKANQTEEAIAEHFGKWRTERGIEKPGLIRDALNRLDLFLKRVGAAARQFLGKDATPDDVFTRIETGEVGRREAAQAEGPARVAAERPRAEERGPLRLTLADRIAQQKQVKGFWKAWTSTFQPEQVSDKAFDADPIFAAFRSKRSNDRDLVTHYLKNDWKYWNKRPLAEKLQWIDDMERGVEPADPEQAAMARTYKTLIERNYQNEKQLGSKAAYVEDYFPHIWEQAREAADWVKTQTAQIGPRWFQKHRSIDFIKDGLEIGLKLKHDNPIDMLQHRFMSGIDMRLRMELLHYLRGMGLAWETRQRIGTEERRPEEAEELPVEAANDPNLFGFKAPEKGREAKQLPLLDSVAGKTLIKKGWQAKNAPDGKQWLIAPDVQALWKNAVEAQSLWQSASIGGQAFRGWMTMKNLWVPIKLAVSMFHPMHVLHINQAQHLAMAVYKVHHGQDWAGALGELGQTFPGAFYSDVKRGAAGKQAWFTPPDQRTPEQRGIVQALTEGGMRPGIPEEMKIRANKSFQEALGRMMRKEAGAKDYLKFAGSALGVGIEKMQGVIFEKWIPALKVSAYLDQTAALLKAHPDLMQDETRRRTALRAIAKSVDNRYGEMNYDTLFWDRYVKDAGIGSFLSLGWNLGFAREFGGAAIQHPIRAAQSVLGKEVSPGRQAARMASNKLTFATAYVGSAMLWAGAMTYLFNKDDPDEAKQMPSGLDWIFPRIGGDNPDGTPRRVTTMFYTREVPMLMKHVQEQGGNWLAGSGEMLWNKLMFEPFRELLNNRNYYGYDIWDPNAPAYQKIWQGVSSWVGDQMSPMSVTGAEHAAQLSGKEWPSFTEAIQHPGKVTDALMAKGVGLSLLGFGPAPAYVEKTALQNRIAKLYGDYVAAEHRPQEEGANLREKMAVRQAIIGAKRTHDQDALRAAVERGKALGMTSKQMANVGKMPGDVYMFSRLPDALQRDILLHASPEERKKYWPKAHAKVKAAINKLDTAQDQEEDEGEGRADGGAVASMEPEALGPETLPERIQGNLDDIARQRKNNPTGGLPFTPRGESGRITTPGEDITWPPYKAGAKRIADGGKVNLSIGQIAEHADWPKFEAEATPSTNVEDNRSRNPLKLGVQAFDNATNRLGEAIAPARARGGRIVPKGLTAEWSGMPMDRWGVFNGSGEMLAGGKTRDEAIEALTPKRAHGGRVDRRNIDHAPTEAQKKAGNYAKDSIWFQGLQITIENAAGSVRCGTDRNGKPWMAMMPKNACYGYIRRVRVPNA